MDTVASKLLSKTKPASGGCLEFTGYIQSNGYGKAVINRKHDYVHRHAYRLLKGEIHDGADVCHKCDNRKCINPAHLFIGSRLENMRDAQVKGRISSGERHSKTVPKGEDHYLAKLTEAKVRVIREVSGKVVSNKELAEMFGVDDSLIRLVVRRKIWGHI